MTIRGHIQKQQRQLRQIAAVDTAQRAIDKAREEARIKQIGFDWLTKVAA